MLIVGIGSLSALLALGILFAFLNWYAKPEAKPLANNKPAVIDPGKPVADNPNKADEKPASESTASELPKEQVPSEPVPSELVPSELVPTEPTTPEPKLLVRYRPTRHPTSSRPMRSHRAMRRLRRPSRVRRGCRWGKSIARAWTMCLARRIKPRKENVRQRPNYRLACRTSPTVFAPSIEPVLPDASVPSREGTGGP